MSGCGGLSCPLGLNHSTSKYLIDLKLQTCITGNSVLLFFFIYLSERLALFTIALYFVLLTWESQPMMDTPLVTVQVKTSWDVEEREEESSPFLKKGHV